MIRKNTNPLSSMSPGHKKNLSELRKNLGESVSEFRQKIE